MLGKLWSWISGGKTQSVESAPAAGVSVGDLPAPSDKEDDLLETLIPARAKVDCPKNEGEDVHNTSRDTAVAHDGVALWKTLADADDDRGSPSDTISADEFFRR